jgi:hypothetical protein
LRQDMQDAGKQVVIIALDDARKLDHNILV